MMTTDIYNKEFDSLTLTLKAKGNAVIEILCDTKKLILNIEII